MSSARQDEIRRELERIRKKNGGKLRRADVVRAAKADKKGVLGKLFDWNVDRAAMKHWLDRAQEIITRYVTITVVTKSQVIRSVAYVRDPDAVTNVSGYVALDQEAFDRRQATSILLNELERIKSGVERGRDIAAVLDAQHPGLSGMFEKMLHEIIDLRDRLAA
jgi:hypothetical protein